MRQKISLLFIPSIRQKISLGHYIGTALIIGVVIVTVTKMKMIENATLSAEVISEFFNMTLEIRRFEKNYFLYGKKDDYIENLNYTNMAEDLVRENEKAFKASGVSIYQSKVQKLLVEYAELMKELFLLNERTHLASARKSLLEKEIRQKGKAIIDISEEISRKERDYIQDLLSSSLRNMIISILIILAGGIVLGQVLSYLIIKPLKFLENSMGEISDGRFEKIFIKSKEREIVSLNNAFNRMLEELELRQKRLIQAEKLASLGTLLSGVAHELNNPLSNVSSSCQILREEIEEADAEYKQVLLSQIEEQTDRARDIVRALLEFSRTRKTLRKAPLTLKKLVDETVMFIRGQTPSGVKIKINIPNDIIISADKQRMQQALLNLIKNSIDAIEKEGTITITAQSDIKRNVVDIKIRDTGSGIEPEALSKIFDPFFTTKEIGKGSGLGLFITHDLIAEHGGSIKVKSEVGEGTTFFIELPLKEI